jgi:hypothetical protein
MTDEALGIGNFLVVIRKTAGGHSPRGGQEFRIAQRKSAASFAAL